MNTAREIADAIRSLPKSEREKLIDRLETTLPELFSSNYSNQTESQPGGLRINELWHSPDECTWKSAIERYSTFVKASNIDLERELEALDLDTIRRLDPQGWYDFLYHQYFQWKYTAPNRLATSRKSLSKYLHSHSLDELAAVKQLLLSFPRHDIREGLRIASSIPGLGVAGASGLLALMYPNEFGTVDQFAVKALLGVDGLPQREFILRMKPQGLTLEDGVILIEIMRGKAAENNRRFNTAEWTPRKIDKILWTYGR
jgi:hypothetical protein